jgi:hypothetical protein
MGGKIATAHRSVRRHGFTGFPVGATGDATRGHRRAALKAGQIAIQLARRHSRRAMEPHAGLAAERPAAATLRHRGHDEKSYTYRTASAMTNSFTVA